MTHTLTGDSSLEIDGPPGSVELFLNGDLPLGSLGQMRFRANGGWVRHPHVEFVELPIRPSVPMHGVDLAWQQVLTGSPCGELPVTHRFIAGERVESYIGRIERPEVETTMRYSAVLRLMAGTSTMLEAFETGGHIEGDWAAILLLSGICDTVEFTDAMRSAASTVALALADLADG